MKNPRSIMALLAVCLAAGVLSNPVRRSPELEARRRGAIDRSLIRFGRSYPVEPSAADLRDAFQRPTRKGNSFLRFGRTQPITLTTDDLITLLRYYEEDYDVPESKRVSNFVRFGRDPKFIRLGRSVEEEKPSYDERSDLVAHSYPQRKSRGRDHFIRLGRDSEQLNGNDVGDMPEDRKKRSTEPCNDCQS